MNGVRLIDMPWQLQPDHTAVMVYPRPVVNPDQKRSPDMERLYALGIDAYRVAREIALSRPSFELDGVTGKLKVSFGRGAARFQRIEPTAVYRDGMVVPLPGAQ
jgi:outer membrane PBP1 activator LpoA protein